jgi:hypothetical protein
MNSKDKQTMRRAAAVVSAGVIHRLILLALAAISFRKGHWFLGLAGFIFPAGWVAGAVLPSKARQERSQESG